MTHCLDTFTFFGGPRSTVFGKLSAAWQNSHARHTHITMTLLGRSAGTACWLTGVVTPRPITGTQRRGPSNCRKPALERLARHSLFDRYMKAQLRLAGGRKPGRNGLSSDRLSFPSH